MKKLVLPDAIRALGGDFTFGVATSSFQIEGARELRLDCIWDTFCAQQGTILDQSNGDTACDHYSLWKQDLSMLIELGVDAYRFSIAWPRVVEKDGTLNEVGIQFYENILNFLKQHGKQAFITLYHWDLPQHLEDEGGWLSRDTAYAFADYVGLVVNRLGDQADAYITLNEPFCSGYLGYEIGVHAPGQTTQKAGRQANHILLLAHGLAMQKIRQHAPSVPAGIVLNIHPSYPDSASSADQKAAQMASDYLFHWYLTPILTGAYPALLDNLPCDVQPEVFTGDMDIISGKIDFLGLNYYTRAVYRSTNDGWFEEVERNDYPKTEMGWEITPHAFTDLLIGLHQRYVLPPIYITENGAAMADQLESGKVVDVQRIDYFQTHLNALADAIEAGVDIRGYFAWSLMDNFEWALGYSKRFGIVYVDYVTQDRILKDSALAYRDMLYSRS
jgi:beta-glucosidase